MAKYCTNCGKPVDEKASYCANCGTKITTTPPAAAPAYTPTPPPSTSQYSPEVESVLSLNHAGGIIALILAVILLIIGIITLIFFVGIIFIIFGVVNLLVWNKVKEIDALVTQGHYQRAKEEQLTWSLIGLLLGGVVIGIILLVAYLKYDEILRHQPH